MVKNNTPVITNKFMTYSMPYMLWIIIVNIIAITINCMALMWLQKLEDINCKCSENWMHIYIKYFLYAYFIFLLISFLINAYLFLSNTGYSDSQLYSMFRILMLVFNGFGIVNIIISIIYISELKKINCECSEDVRREIYWYYNIVRIIFICLMILILTSTFIALRKMS